MKKGFALLCAAIMLGASLVGCANSSDSSAGGNGDGDKLTIGIIQPMEHPSLNTIRESFLEELKSLGYDDSKVEILYQNAQNDPTNTKQICDKFVGDEVDLIVAIATPAAQAAASSTKEIPVLFSAVTDPVTAKLMNELQKPDKNVTGTSDAIPVDRTFELCKQLTPEVKKFGFLYTASEDNSAAVIEQAKEAAKEFGFEYEVMTITNTNELQQAAQSLADRVDAIYVPIDNTIADAMAILSKVGTSTKTPVYVGADSMVEDGGLATVGIDYTVLGKQTAQMAKKILEGTSISDLPVETLTNFATVINKKTAEALGITIPEELSSSAVIVE